MAAEANVPLTEANVNTLINQHSAIEAAGQQADNTSPSTNQSSAIVGL